MTRMPSSPLLVVLSLVAGVALLGIVAFVAGNAAPVGPSCLCVDETVVPPAPTVVTRTHVVTITEQVTKVVTATRVVAVTDVVTHYVAVTLPRGEITESLRIMYSEPGAIEGAGAEDLRKLERAGGCYITDTFVAELGGIYYRIYVCLLVKEP